MNRHELIEATTAGRTRHRDFVRTLSSERRDAGAELDAARAALAAARHRAVLAENAVAALEGRVNASNAALLSLEARNAKLLRDTALPMVAFRREADAELERLCSELSAPTVRSIPTGAVRVDGTAVRQAFSEGPSRSRRAAAIRDAVRQAEDMAVTVADLDELTHELAALLVDLPKIEVEPIGEAA